MTGTWFFQGQIVATFLVQFFKVQSFKVVLFVKLSLSKTFTSKWQMNCRRKCIPFSSIFLGGIKGKTNCSAQNQFPIFYLSIFAENRRETLLQKAISLLNLLHHSSLLKFQTITYWNAMVSDKYIQFWSW